MSPIKTVFLIVLSISSLAVFDSEKSSAQFFRGRFFNRSHHYELVDPCCQYQSVNPCCQYQSVDPCCCLPCENDPPPCKGGCFIKLIDNTYHILTDTCQDGCQCNLPLDRLREGVDVGCIRLTDIDLEEDLAIQIPAGPNSLESNGDPMFLKISREKSDVTVRFGEVQIHARRFQTSGPTEKSPSTIGEYAYTLRIATPDGYGETLRIPTEGDRERSLSIGKWQIRATFIPNLALDFATAGSRDDVIAEFNNPDQNIPIFESRRDSVVVGSTSMFSSIAFELQGMTNDAVPIEPTIEYSIAGGGWKVLDERDASDGTLGMIRSGEIIWRPDAVADWKATNDGTEEEPSYKIKITRKALLSGSAITESRVLLRN